MITQQLHTPTYWHAYRHKELKLIRTNTLTHYISDHMLSYQRALLFTVGIAPEVFMVASIFLSSICLLFVYVLKLHFET